MIFGAEGCFGCGFSTIGGLDDERGEAILGVDETGFIVVVVAIIAAANDVAAKVVEVCRADSVEVGAGKISIGGGELMTTIVFGWVISPKAAAMDAAIIAAPF
ncbi:MAG: hypothetical protein AAB536_03395 [Patescibacteria group bacterium]